MDPEIVLNVDLARETSVWRELGFHRESIAFELTHFTRVALEKFNAASCATSVAAAAVQDVDAGVFNDKNEFLPGRCVDFNEASSSLSLDLRHVCTLAPLILCAKLLWFALTVCSCR